MNSITKIYKIIFEEGIVNFIKRKRNITYLDSITTFTINYKNRKTKIILNRKFGHVDMMIFKNGIYEKEIVDDIYNELDSSKVLLDIGSNIGQHSLLLSPYCKEIHAFEPIPAVYEQFKKSIALNNFENIHVYNTAIGDRKETTSFNFVATHAGTSSFIERDNPNVEKIEVQINTLDDILKDKKVDVVKIDVEGYEAVVILGNKEFFLKNKPTIFLEFNRHWMDKQEGYSSEMLFDFLHNNQYSIYSRVLDKPIEKEDLPKLRQDNWIVKHK